MTGLAVGLDVVRMTGLGVGLDVVRMTGLAVGLDVVRTEVVGCVGAFVDDSFGRGVARTTGFAVGLASLTETGDCVGATVPPNKVSFRIPQKPFENVSFQIGFKIGEGICEGIADELSMVGVGERTTLGRLLAAIVGAMDGTTVGDRDGRVVAASLGSALAIGVVSANRPTIKCDTNSSWTGSCTAEKSAVVSFPQTPVMKNAPPGCSVDQHHAQHTQRTNKRPFVGLLR